MIDNEAYVKGLIKKQVKGNLTKEEYVEWKLAKLLYDEQIWFRMKVDAYCELEAARTDREPVDWRPAFDRMQQRLMERERLAAIPMAGGQKNKTWWWLSGIAAVIALATFIMLPDRKIPHQDAARWVASPQVNEQAVGCAENDRDRVIPATDFAGAIVVGAGAPITIDSTVWGHIARVGNLSIDRGSDGYLSLTKMRSATRADTLGRHDIQLFTQGGQQCGIRLPDGTVVRLNMGSMLVYPLVASEPGKGRLQLRGEAYLQVTQQPDGTMLVLETKNGRIHTSGAEFTVATMDIRTSAVVLEGAIRMVSRHEGKDGYATARGERLDVVTTYVPEKPMDALLKEYLPDADKALQWTKAIQVYRDVPLADFIKLRSPWQKVRFSNMDCVPKHKRITVAMCYRASTEDFLAVIEEQGVPVNRDDGQYALCDEKKLKKRRDRSVTAQLGADGECGHCETIRRL